MFKDSVITYETVLRDVKEKIIEMDIEGVLDLKTEGSPDRQFAEIFATIFFDALYEKIHKEYYYNIEKDKEND